MLKCSGKSVFQGIAIGKIYLYQRQSLDYSKRQIEDTAQELLRFQTAKKKTISQLGDLYQRALGEVGEEQAEIFEVHQMMLEDGDYVASIEHTIREENCNAEYAVMQAAEAFAKRFEAMDDAYMSARAADIRDISVRLAENLSGHTVGKFTAKEPVILLADDLSPSETVQMDKSKILAVVTKNGSVNSHTAILARSMNLPCLVKTDVGLLEEYHNTRAVVDGIEGQLILNPTPEVLNALIQKKMQYEKERTQLQALKGKPTVTKNGRKIRLYANIGSEEELAQALENDASGIGLFRSEFLYLGRKDYPTEEEQFLVYRNVLSRMEGKTVIIRTLDIGADKQADYFAIPKEENPALGYRAIRICLDRPQIFKTQLRAIYRASAFGKAAIMFPMIISVEEIRKIKELVRQVQAELDEEAYSYNHVELGIMIETPAAVMLSEELAKEVDFFSIGTNDLTQYTLAIDRQNQNLDAFYNPHHPAVLRMIQMTIENGHKGGVWVGICGELAADRTLTKTFVDMGVDELSVAPAFVLGIRKQIREM